MTPGRFNLVSQVGRVPSMTVPLDRRQESRFQRLMEESIMIDLHQHPMVLPEDVSQYWEYLRSDSYVWGYDAVREGGFTAVGTANVFRGMLHTNEMSFIRFSDLLDEISMMISDISRYDDVLQVNSAAEIESAKQQGKVGFLPTVEHLAIGNELNRVDVLYNAGIRLAGLTYSRKAYIGDGIFERNDGGLSEFGMEVVQRMNDLGMVVDVSHASFRTAMDAIEASETPVTFSHDGSYTLASDSLQARRLRKDEELLACARKGGVIGITAVPNRLSNGHGDSATPLASPAGANHSDQRWATTLKSLDSRAADEEDQGGITGGASAALTPATVPPRKPTFLQKERWKAIQKAMRKGMPLRAIERELGIHRATIKKYMDADGPPGRRSRPALTASISDTVAP